MQFQAYRTFDLSSSSNFYPYFKQIFMSSSSVDRQRHGSRALCESADEVQRLMDILVNGGMNSTVTVSCNGQLWTSKICPSFDGGSPALCVNCKDPCSLKAGDETSLVINPCATVSHVPFSTFLDVTMISSNLAPHIFNVDVIASRESFEVRVDLSDNGIVYCGVDTLQNGVNSNGDIMVQGFQAESKFKKASIQIDGLVPDTTYDVYCMAMSYSGVESSFEVMSIAKVSFCVKTSFLLLFFL
jgi:hypothetical protein